MVVNPASDHGRTARRWPEIARAAASRGLDLDVRATQAAGHASELTRAALREGADLIVAVGGDGTVSEVANGFFDGDAPIRPEAELAVIPRGSGCDFVKTFEIPKQVDRAVEIASGTTVRTIDLGRVRFSDWDGQPAARIFCNVASAGLTGVAADRVNRSGKPLGATVAFAWGTIVTFAGYRNSRFRVRIDKRELDQVCNNVIVANCRFYASGMKIMPMADPGDGLLDVLVWGDVGKADLARNLHRLYRGTHIGHPKADISRARRVTVEPDLTLPIEADGETPGVTPVAFEVVPAALRLRVPS
jgi:diacylglycerol kinase (ATP)